VRWSTFTGRWMLLAAVNRLAQNTTIANATDLARPAR
jgi:hypothetical protein